MAIFYFCLELIKTCPWGIQALFSKLFFCKQLSESTKKKWTDRQLLTSKLLSEISPSLFSVGRVKSIFIFGCYCLVKNTYFVFKIPNTTTPVFNYILWLLLFCIFLMQTSQDPLIPSFIGVVLFMAWAIGKIKICHLVYGRCILIRLDFHMITVSLSNRLPAAGWSRIFFFPL